MSKITIYNPKGEELKTLLPKGFVKKKLMSDNYVQLEWNSTIYDTLVGMMKKAMGSDKFCYPIKTTIIKSGKIFIFT